MVSSYEEIVKSVYSMLYCGGIELESSRIRYCIRVRERCQSVIAIGGLVLRFLSVICDVQRSHMFVYV